MAAEAGLKALLALLKAAQMETELAGSRAGALRGLKSAEMPLVNKMVGRLGRGAAGKTVGTLGTSARADIESAANTGAAKALTSHDFFPGARPVIKLGEGGPEAITEQPLESKKLRSLPANIYTAARKEITRAKPSMSNIPVSEDIQKLTGRIRAIENEWLNKFGGRAGRKSEQFGLKAGQEVESMGDRPSPRFIARMLKTKFGQDVPEEHVRKLQAGIIPRGGPFAEEGQLPKHFTSLDQPIGEEGIDTLGSVMPEDVKERPEVFTQGMGKVAESKQFREYIDKLPDRQREALLKYYVDEMPQAEIAKEMGVSQPSINALIKKATLNMQKEFTGKKGTVPRNLIRRGKKVEPPSSPNAD